MRFTRARSKGLMSRDDMGGKQKERVVNRVNGSAIIRYDKYDQTRTKSQEGGHFASRGHLAVDRETAKTTGTQ